MDGQRHRANRGRRRRARERRGAEADSEPVLIAARRPDSPRVETPSRSIAASARPQGNRAGPAPENEPEVALDDPREGKPRRVARIVQATRTESDSEVMRAKLLRRLLQAEGQIAITRAANELWELGFSVPEEQEPQVQLLDHRDEQRARQAMEVLERLLERQPPAKRPIFERRLRRLEQEADEAETRERAAALRKAIRVA